jgi:acyl dehydratase
VTTTPAAGAAAGRPTYESVAVGDVIAPVAFPLVRSDLVRYAGASGDFNPIHWNERFAHAVGLPDVIAHGMLTMATAVRLVTDWCGDPGAVVEYGTKFTKPVVVPDDDQGASVLVSGVVAAKDDDARTVRVDLTAASGPDATQKVLGRAQAVVRLP